nr:ribonucleoside-diphosphate reductase subunit alpha [Bdellovibrio sp. HM001]
MKVQKRNGSFEAAKVEKIVQRIEKLAKKDLNVDPVMVGSKVIAGIYDGMTTSKIDDLAIREASLLGFVDPDYTKLAARLQVSVIDKEVKNQGINSFVDSIKKAHEVGLLSDRTLEFVSENSVKLLGAINENNDLLFDFTGIKTVYDRYLLKHPKTRLVIETPQYFLMRVACGVATSVKEAISFYEGLSSMDFMASTPTLFNSGTRHEQMSSCYLVDSPQDSIEDIFASYNKVALLSKWAGGIGIAWHRVRARGSLIKGTNGKSNGLVPWLKILDSTVGAVNQGGKRKGAACAYLETWHADIESFLELRDNTGDHEQRTHNLNIANWVPDLFMARVRDDKEWSLLDPKNFPELTDLFGEEFEKAYLAAELSGKVEKKVKARDLYARMMRTLAQTGNGWMCFKDSSNQKCNQTLVPGNVVHLSNLCTEILEVTDKDNVAVCNLTSINLARHVKNGQVDFNKLAKSVKTAVRMLNNVIDRNFYPVEEASRSNNKWRPVGLGIMGLQDVFFQLKLPFDSVEALNLSNRISEEVYLNALSASADLAKEHGPFPEYNNSRTSQGVLQMDLWKGASVTNEEGWAEVREKIRKHGLRNSLLIAIAPTATIASITGCYECIEPQVSNLFKRETLSGEFFQVNRYLVEDLKKNNLWNDEVRAKIKAHDGSIQEISEIPVQIRHLYRNVWEIPQKALIDLAAGRGPFIDQSQSLNLFMASPNIGKLSSMYMYAWEKGIKTTYYLRSRPASSIAKTTLENVTKEQANKAVVCSLENPGACESCQ